MIVKWEKDFVETYSKNVRIQLLEKQNQRFYSFWEWDLWKQDGAFHPNSKRGILIPEHVLNEFLLFLQSASIKK